jgi:hypothetical protein
MGLAELLLGKSNPISQFVSENQNKIRGAFAGFGAEPGFSQSLSNAAMGAAQGAPLDQSAAEKRQLLQQDADAKNKTVAYLRAQPGGQQFADAIEQGGMDGATAFKSWIDASKGQQPIEINGQLVDPKTMQVLGDFRTPETGSSSAPSGFRQTTDGNLEFIPGGPADPATKGGDMTQAEQRNQQLAMVIGPELQTVEKNWSALADGGNQVIGTEVNGARPGLALTSPEYQQAINSLSTIVASYLYSVSGATATDAEIKRQVDLLTPKFGESEVSANQKLQRIRTYAQAVQQAAGGGNTQAPLGSGEGWTVLGVE